MAERWSRAELEQAFRETIAETAILRSKLEDAEALHMKTLEWGAKWDDAAQSARTERDEARKLAKRYHASVSLCIALTPTTAAICDADGDTIKGWAK